MGKLRGFYALFVAIAVLCTSTLAFSAIDNQSFSKFKDQRTTILAGPDTHDVTVSIFNYVILPVSADAPEICPEDFTVTLKDASLNFEQEYLKQERTSPGNIIQTLFIIPEEYRSTKRQFTRKKKYIYNTRSKTGKEVLITTYSDFVLLPPLLNKNVPADNTDLAISEALEDPHLQNVRSTI